MNNTRKTLKDKLLIVEEAEQYGNTRATARKYNIQPCQIRNWRRNIDQLRNPQAKSNIERKLFKPQVEKEILLWMKELRSMGIIINTGQIIIKSLSIDPGFHNGNKVALRKWVHVFLEKQKFYRGLTLSYHLEQTKNDFVGKINARFKPGGNLSDVDNSLFVNMDETVVCFDSKSIQRSEYNSRKMTVCVACAYDGTKLPLFFVFKGKPGGNIEKNMQRELGDNVFGCCQEKGRMDERASRLWIEKIWKPYVKSKGPSFLLLDEFQCDLTQEVNDIGTKVGFIPGSHASILQSCDVGIDKLLKKIYMDLCMKWSNEKCNNVFANDKLSKPSRKDEVKWMIQAWGEISKHIVHYAYKNMGYETKNGVEEIIEGVMKLAV